MELKRRLLWAGIGATALAIGMFVSGGFANSARPLTNGLRGPMLAGGMMSGGWGSMAAMHGSMMGGGGTEQVPNTPPASDAERVEKVLTIKEWAITPADFQVEKGKHLVLTIRNDGAVPHNFAIPKLGVRLINIAPGSNRIVELNLDQAGTFNYLCDLPGHDQLGQRGTLSVS